MTGRGFAALLLALAGVGGVAGVAAADLSRPAATTAQLSPIPAQDPSIPVDPLPTLAPDSTAPPLGTAFATVPANVGGAVGYDFPVPRSWQRQPQVAPNEVRYQPTGASPVPYRLRVEQITTSSRPPQQMVAAEPGILSGATAVSHLSQLDSSGDTLTVCFIQQSAVDAAVFHEVCTAYGWVPPPGAPTTSNSDVEVAVTGRREDVPGLEALRGLIMAGLHRP